MGFQWDWEWVEEGLKRDGSGIGDGLARGW